MLSIVFSFFSHHPNQLYHLSSISFSIVSGFLLLPYSPMLFFVFPSLLKSIFDFLLLLLPSLISLVPLFSNILNNLILIIKSPLLVHSNFSSSLLYFSLQILTLV